MPTARQSKTARPSAPIRAAGRRSVRVKGAPTVDVYREITPGSIVTDDGDPLAVPDRMTADEFAEFPWPDLQRWELMHGVPVMAASPLPQNQDLLLTLGSALKQQLPDDIVLCECDYVPPGHLSYVTPDLMVVSRVGYDRTQRYTGTPKLLVEVVSPSNAPNDWGVKRGIYATAGVPEYWIVDPNLCTIAIHTRPEQGRYAAPTVDAEGFAFSPLLNLRLKLRLVEPTYEISTAEPAAKPARKAAKKKRSK